MSDAARWSALYASAGKPERTDLDELTCSGLSFLSRFRLSRSIGEDALPTPHISAACCEARLAEPDITLAASSFCIAASLTLAPSASLIHLMEEIDAHAPGRTFALSDLWICMRGRTAGMTRRLCDGLLISA